MALAKGPLADQRRYNATFGRGAVIDLQGEYSMQLYGADGRVPLDTLKVVWMSALSDDALRTIASGGGVCIHSANHVVPPLYIAHHHSSDPIDTMWLRRGLRGYPITWGHLPNDSWVEVTHCATRADLTKNATFGNGMGAWFYVAPGSGVSINVGRTMVGPGFLATKRQLLPAIWRDVKLVCHGREPAYRVRAANGTWSDAIPGKPPRSLLGPYHALDTVQIHHHQEFFSHEGRQEVVLLRHPDCGFFDTALRSAVRCGRHPWLRPCSSEELERASHCSTAVKDILSARVKRLVGQGCNTSAAETAWEVEPWAHRAVLTRE